MDAGAMIRQRVYDAFFLRSRLGELDALIEAAKKRGYRFLSIAEFHDALANGRALSGPALILRHDLDWDLRTARAMFELERGHKISTSWYFRLATANTAFMRELAEDGQDVSYHFEELATLGMCNGAANAEELRALISQAREQFCRNLARLRAQTGLPMRIVASHGDFLNRKLGVTNSVLIDCDIRRRMDILAEVYDDLLANSVSARFADCGGPNYWRPADPLSAIERREPVVYILLHPSNWDSNALGAAWQIAGRLGAEMIYRFRLKNHRRAPQ